MPDLIDELERLRQALAEVQRQLEAARTRSQELTAVFEAAEARCVDTIRRIKALHGTLEPPE